MIEVAGGVRCNHFSELPRVIREECIARCVGLHEREVESVEERVRKRIDLPTADDEDFLLVTGGECLLMYAGRFERILEIIFECCLRWSRSSVSLSKDDVTPVGERS